MWEYCMVFIESIKIENFRGIEKGEVKGLEKVNILLGANGAGKSTILESIYLASAWANPIDELRVLRKEDYVVSRRTGRGVWSSTRDVLWYKMDTDREVKISINFRETNASMNFVVPYHVSGVVSGESYVFLKPPHNIIETHGVPLNTMIYISSLPVCRLFKPIEGVFSGVLSDKARGLINKLYGKAIAVLKNVVFIDSTFMRNPRFIEERLWSKLLSKRLDKEVVRVLREGYEVSVEDLTYAPLPSGEYMLFLKLPDTSIGIDSLGDGARNAVALLAALVLARDTVVLIETLRFISIPMDSGY